MRRLALVAGAALCSAGAAQAGVIVKASGPSAGQFPVGKKIADGGRVTLKAGDSLTVLTAKGTKVINGPGEFAVGVSGESKRSTFAVLTQRAATARVRTGAVRGGAGSSAPTNPSLWNMDVTKPGRFCIADKSRVTFWRPTSTGDKTYVLASGKSDYPIQLNFANGAAQSSLTAEQLPLASNASYRLISEAGGEPQQVEFVMLDSVPDLPDELGAMLADKGCNAQFLMLADRLATTDH